MTAQELIELLKMVKPEAKIQIQSIEEPEVGLVDIAIIYDEDHVEICEKMEE